MVVVYKIIRVIMKCFVKKSCFRAGLLRFVLLFGRGGRYALFRQDRTLRER